MSQKPGRKDTAQRGPNCCLELEDGTRLAGSGFGHRGQTSGEVVFTTGMTGYVESLTDPSYRGQILVFTYPLIGNYGVPAQDDLDRFESSRIQVAGVVVAFAHSDASHARAARSLKDWLASEQVPGIEGIDTRHLTMRLREKGTMLGRIVPLIESKGAREEERKGGREEAGRSQKVDGNSKNQGIEESSRQTEPSNPGVLESSNPAPFFDPNKVNIVAETAGQTPERFGSGGKRVILVDCGVKRSIRRELLARGIEVFQVPWDFDYTGEQFSGILVSNGPGNPEQCRSTIEILRRAMALNRPIFGICLGAQLMALAAGARTYKLRYGHRGQNQPCLETDTEHCRLTSQNHGFAIDASTLPADWSVWFLNANDGSVEGIRHKRRPFSAVQFHPEASPGPLDSRDLFDAFVRQL
jgi:carbamoyl-phosphate synthase small subunit